MSDVSIWNLRPEQFSEVKTNYVEKPLLKGSPRGPRTKGPGDLARTLEHNPPAEGYIAKKQIAEHLKVKSAAVSNWATRHEDFPVANDRGHHRIDSVNTWLISKGKRSLPPAYRAVDHG